MRYPSSSVESPVCFLPAGVSAAAPDTDTATAMAPSSTFSPLLVLLLVLLLSPGGRRGVDGATFTLVNRCGYGVWPGISADAGSELLGQGGMALEPGQTVQLEAPAGWSGRFWGRTGCSFDSTGKGTCETGDCGGVLQCNGAGGSPPVTLAEFTLGGAKDFYDVSLVDGYNVALTVAANGGDLTASASAGGETAPCATAGCPSSNSLLLGACPPALVQTDSTGQVVACRSACDAFNSPQFCCTGAFSTPQTCSPSSYSQLFKSACPSAYSYAYDDPTSTFTCPTPSGYTITFCPSS